MKCLLFFVSSDFNNVLKQGIHKIDFKAQGVVELTVKLLTVKKEKVRPPVLRRPKVETLEHVDSAQATTGEQVRLFFFYF